jgi:hypothetical protein
MHGGVRGAGIMRVLLTVDQYTVYYESGAMPQLSAACITGVTTDNALLEPERDDSASHRQPLANVNRNAAHGCTRVCENDSHKAGSRCRRVRW